MQDTLPEDVPERDTVPDPDFVKVADREPLVLKVPETVSLSLSVADREVDPLKDNVFVPVAVGDSVR